MMDRVIDRTEMNDAKRQPPQRIRRFQTISLVLLVVCGTINYLDRGALSRESSNPGRSRCFDR